MCNTQDIFSKRGAYNPIYVFKCTEDEYAEMGCMDSEERFLFRKVSGTSF